LNDGVEGNQRAFHLKMADEQGIRDCGQQWRSGWPVRPAASSKEIHSWAAEGRKPAAAALSARITAVLKERGN
jgi:hypothetical protein